MVTLRCMLLLSCLCACAPSATGQERSAPSEDDPFGAPPPALDARKAAPAGQPAPRSPANTIPDDDPFGAPPPDVGAKPATKAGTRSFPLPASQRGRALPPEQPERPAADPVARTADDAPPAPISIDGGASINPEVLTKVQDNQLGLQFEDRSAYFRILSLAKQLPLAHQQEFARQFRDQRRAEVPKYQKRPAGDFPAFIDMFLNPDLYRGRPVTLKGYLRRLVKFSPGPNDNKIGEVYEGWLYTADSQNNPAVVVFQRKPEGLPIGGNLVEEVEVTGYFFKMYGYEAQDTTRKAPMILAGEVQWTPAKTSHAFQPLPNRIYVYLTVGIALVGGVFWWRSVQIRKAQRAAIAARYAGRDFDAFPPVEMREETFVETNDS